MLMVTYVIFNIIPSSYIAGVIVSNLFTYINIFGMVTLVLALIYGFHIESIRFFKKIQHFYKHLGWRSLGNAHGDLCNF